jgi:hypothetical protein
MIAVLYLFIAAATVAVPCYDLSPAYYVIAAVACVAVDELDDYLQDTGNEAWRRR